MKVNTKETQAAMTPASSLTALKKGNQRFQNNLKADRNLPEQVSDTSTGQFPFATVLSCSDSCVSSELIFYKVIGDIFSVHIAGNFGNEDIPGREDSYFRNSSNTEFVHNVSAENVQLTIDRILQESDILAETVQNEDISIVGGMYDILTGAVTFYE